MIIVYLFVAGMIALAYFAIKEYHARFYWCGREEQSLYDGTAKSFTLVGESVTRIEKENGGSSYSGKWMYYMLIKRCPEFEKAE